jgi:replicative DNA helicase
MFTGTALSALNRTVSGLCTTSPCRGNHNFVAGNIIVHNSIEQDADVVLFIYREDYYIEDSDKRRTSPM